MRLLVACPRCRRQFDATGLAPGTQLPCTCGGVAVVPEPVAHDAEIVRCSSCGAPRGDGEAACRFCGSEYTLRERDLDTVCPGCMARVSSRSRFCHRCGTPLLHGQAAAPGAGQPCPACGDGRPLRSRALDGAGVAVAECGICGGFWVEREVFEVLARRAREKSLPELGPAGERPSGPAAPPRGSLYRPCPSCRRLMNRKNWGRKSGIIVDVCREHGAWFDLDELERLLAWIREGGEERARGLIEEQDRTAERQARLFPTAGWEEDDDPWSESLTGSLLLDLFSRLLGGLRRFR